MASESHEVDFSRRIRDLTAEFVGRDWLFAEVDGFLAGADARVLLIEGEPGAGKSTIAARLVQRGAASAHHFCVPHEAGTREPVSFVRSMSLQLVRGAPGFGQHLVERAAARRVEAQVNVGSAENTVIYGVYVDKLIVNARSAEEAFQVLLREPLQAFAEEGGGRLALLVDSLDEATRLDRRPNIADLIASSRDLPPGVRWIVTSRPGGPLAEAPGVRRIVLNGAAGHLQDLAAFVDAALAEPSVAAALARSGQDAGAFRRALLEGGDAHDRGNLLYLRYVIRQLREDAAAGRPISSPDALPAGLDAVYREHLERPLQGRPKDERRRLVRPILGVLAAAQEPLPASAIKRFSGVPDQDVSDVLDDLKELLDTSEEGGEPVHRLYHASFCDFLCDRRRNPGDWIDVAVYHRQIAERALSRGAGASGSYALRHAPTHLARAAALLRARGDEGEAHEATEGLVRLVLGADFSEAHARVIGDPAAHYRMVEEALRQAAEDTTEGGLPLTVEAALGLVGVRRRQLSPARAFERARAGDLDGAERQIALFELEPGWRRACLLIAAWLAAPRNAEAARALVERIRGAWRPDEALDRLRDRVEADLEGQPWALPPPPEPSPGEMDRLVARLAGMKARLGLTDEGPRNVTERLPWDDTPDVPAGLRASASDMAALVGHAAARPGDPGRHARDYLAILASNAYVQYRNLFLQAALGAVLRHPDRAWAQGMAVEAAMAALSPVRQASADAFPIALLACQAAADPAARAKLDGFSAEVARAAEARRVHPGDVWGSFTRRFAALGQAYHLLGDTAAARASLSMAVGLRYGFAVPQTFASLCLAEALRATGAEASAIRGVLAAARRSAHNIQDPMYLARTSARYNALCARYWQDPAAGFPAEPAVLALTAHPPTTARAAMHRVGERYEDRALHPGRPPLPDKVLHARTLRALAELHAAPLRDVERLNPGCAPDEELADGHEVALPDAGMGAIASARVAAEAMVEPALATPGARARMIQRLVPVAAERSAVLDTVLARLVLAAHPLPAATLRRLLAAARSAQPSPREAARTAREDEPTAWAWLT